jgi:hypothetical protein
MNKRIAAQALSILAHPTVVMPVAVVGAAVNRGAPVVGLLLSGGAAIAVAFAAMAFSYFRVRSGRWSHADASRPAERLQLNVFLVVALLLAAGVLWGVLKSEAAAVGAMVCAGVVLSALLLRGWLKLSLHVAFAALGASLLWPSKVAVLCLAVLAGAVAWSRLVLLRHTPAEVGLGALVGVLAGVLMHVLAPHYR